MTNNHSRRKKIGGLSMPRFNLNSKKPLLQQSTQQETKLLIPVEPQKESSIFPKITQGGMSDAFSTMYKLMGAFCLVIYFILFVISLVDVGSYVSKESTQSLTLVKDPNLFIKDTTDYESMNYILTGKDAHATKGKTPKEEPYSIFIEESIVSYLYVIIGIFILLFAMQYSFWLFLYIRSSLSGGLIEKPEAVVQSTYQPFIVVGIAGIGAIVMSYLYKKYFVKNTLGALKEIRSELQDIKQYIYKNLTKNAEFLHALVTHNMQSLLVILNTEISKNNRNNCSTSTSTCDIEVEKMIFTVSLYSYLVDQIPEVDSNYEKVNAIFTVDNIQHSTIDIPSYFYYKQSLYIPNIYTTIQNSNGANLFTDTNRETVFMKQLKIAFETINKKLARLQTISRGKQEIRKYIIRFSVVATIFLIVLVALFFMEYIDSIQGLYTKLRRLFGKQ
jgi:hypothetical protein